MARPLNLDIRFGRNKVARTEAGKNPFGLVGLVVGVLALGGALAHFFVGPINPPPPLETIAAEKVVKIKESIAAKLRGEELPQTGTVRGWDADRVVETSTAMTGFLAMVLAIVSFIRREDLRVSGSAAAVGAGAVAFQFVIAALGALILVILIAAILGSLGGG